MIRGLQGICWVWGYDAGGIKGNMKQKLGCIEVHKVLNIEKFVLLRFQPF